MPAFRNIRLCTKDCLCLFVCPTGATNTENGQIDFDTCIKGCSACMDACPSGAISILPDEYPNQQDKNDAVISALLTLAQSKAAQEQTADSIAKATDNAIAVQLAQALSMSNRVMAEDLLRESGYMLPQSDNSKEFLQSLLDNDQPTGFPVAKVKRLLEIL